MMTYKMVIMALLLLNAASGIWSAQILFGNEDFTRTAFSAVYAISCLILFFFLLLGRNYHQWPMVFLLMSSLSLFTIDRIRGKNESLARRGNKNE